MVRLEELSIDLIDAGEGVRRTIEEEPLEELASSIARHGVLQPLVVESGEAGRYRLLIGQRRLAAARAAGLGTVPALVLDAPLGPEESLAVRLVENIHREGLDPIDEAEAYAALREMGVKVSEIARRVGKERTYVSHSMRLLRLHPRIREMVRSGLIDRGHALALLRLDPEQQLMVADEILEKGLNLYEVRDRVREILGRPLKWRLVPIRIEADAFERLKAMAPDGDVAKLLKKAVERLLS